MRRIDLAPYPVSATFPDPDKPGSVKTVSQPFDVTGSVVTVLFGRGADGRELLKRDGIAKKIEAAKGKAVLLEEEEYQTLLAAFRDWKTFTRYEVELIRRVEDAPKVEVGETKPKANRKRSRE